MSTSTWHLEPGDLDRYVDGRAAGPLEASVDAHLLSCARCRQEVNVRLRVIDPVATTDRWERVAAAIDRPSPTMLERLMMGVGLSHVQARALVATPRMVSAWLGSLALTCLAVLVASSTGGVRWELTVFLIAAPVLPMAGTAILYSAKSEPPGAIALATPGRGPALLAARTAFVLVTALPPLLVIGALVPGPSAVATAWVLPGLGLAALTLAVRRIWDPIRVAVVLGSVWVIAVGQSAIRDHRRPFVDFSAQLLPLRPGAQLLFAVVVVLATSAVVIQRDQLPWRSAR